jgi:L-seryl-tRNA(Ser) seleniumtransferase
MIDAPAEEIAARAKRFARKLRASGYEADTAPGESVTGGGSLPGAGIPTTLVLLRHPKLGANEISAALRGGDPPVLARVEERSVVIDLRTVLDGQERALYQAFASLT